MDWNEALFLTKVDNIFVKILTGIMKENMDSIAHFMNQTVYEECQKKIENLKSKGIRQIYDELNVKSTTVLNREVTKEKETVTVRITSRYMDYQIKKDSGEIISGTDKKRIEKDYLLTFEKKSQVENHSLIIKCPSCGASMSLNTTGKCAFCGCIYNQEDYDYILISFIEK